MMHFTRKASSIAIATLAASFLGGTANAAAFYLQEQSVKGLGRAFSGEVADQGAESMWWNPASIAGMKGTEGYFGATAILPRGDIVNDGTLIVRPGQRPAPVGGDDIAKNPINNGVLPAGGIAHAITDKLAIGVVITSPFSFTTDYEAGDWTRYTADKTKLLSIDVQPTIGYAPVEWLRIGFGANIRYTDAELSNALPQLSPLLADGHQTLKGDGISIGWSAGAQVVKGPLSLGVSYKSSIRQQLSGSLTTEGLLGPLAGQNGTINTKAEFRLPWQLTFGGRFKLLDKLTLNASASHFGWDKFDAIYLKAPINAAIPEGYARTWSYAGGIDYDVSQRLTLRAGVQRDETPTNDGHRDARVPDGSRWIYAGGGSYRATDMITIDAAFSYIDIAEGPIDRLTAAYAGTPAQTPIIVNGHTEGAHALVFGLGARMAF